MGFLNRGNKGKPAWLESTREFCLANSITIAAWGPHMLVVEAKSAGRAGEIAAQLANLGFQAIQDEIDADAGLLSLAHPD